MEIKDIKTAADLRRYLHDHTADELKLQEQGEATAFRNADLLAKVDPRKLSVAIASLIVAYMPHDQFCSFIELAVDLLIEDELLKMGIGSA